MPRREDIGAELLKQLGEALTSRPPSPKVIADSAAEYHRQSVARQIADDIHGCDGQLYILHDGAVYRFICDTNGCRLLVTVQAVVDRMNE